MKPVRQLILTKILNFQGKRISKRLEASAATQREGRFSALMLYLATTTQVDMYEYVAHDPGIWGNVNWRSRVANSLCRVLFKQPKVNDSLLFMTILSTDLRSLRRRGFNGMTASFGLFMANFINDKSSRPYFKPAESRAGSEKERGGERRRKTSGGKTTPTPRAGEAGERCATISTCFSSLIHHAWAHPHI